MSTNDSPSPQQKREREYVPFPILDQLYSQKAVGPTPFASEKTPNATCEPSGLVQAEDPRDTANTFHYRMTFPSALRGVQYQPESIRATRGETNFFEEVVPPTELEGGISTLPAPNPYWLLPPQAMNHPISTDHAEKKRLPRDTLHPLISSLQAQENTKAAGFNPQVGYLSNASLKGPPCEAHLMKEKVGQTASGSGTGTGEGEEAVEEDAEENEGLSSLKANKKTHSRKGDPKTAVGRAYSSEGGFHDPDQYSSKIIEFAFSQPTSLTAVAAKAIAGALHDRESHSIPANVIRSRHLTVEPNSGPHGTNANRYQFCGVSNASNAVLPPSAGFRNLSPEVKSALLKRTRETRHRVAEVLKDKYLPTQPPPFKTTTELAPLVEGETLRQPEQAVKRFGHVDSDDEDEDYVELPDDAQSILGDGSQLSLWNLALRRKGRRHQQIDEAHLAAHHPIREVLGNDRKLRVLTPELISVYNSGSATAQFQRYLGGVGLRMAETLAQTKPPSQSSFHRDAKFREPNRQFSDIAYTPNNTFGFDNNRFQMLLADKGDEIEEIFLDGLQLNEQSLKAIGTYCPSLQLLNVANNNQLTDHVLEYIAQRCGQLAYLNITNCPELSGESLAAVFQHCRSLHVLVASGLPLLDSASVLAWARLYLVPQLAFVDLSFCENLPDEALTSLAEHCRGLEGLDISGCVSVGNTGVASIGSSCSRLTRWQLRLCSQLTEASFLCLSLAPRNLRSLDLSGCTLTSKTLEGVVKHLPCLRNLAIGGCPQLDDEAVASVTRYCRALRELNLSSCVGVSLHSCLALIHELVHLKRLVVSESTISNAEVVMLSAVRETCRIVRNQFRPPPVQKLVAFVPIEAKKKAKPAPKKGKK